MNYYFNTMLDADFEEALARTKAALKTEGFGVLTEIDVKKALHEKLGVDFPDYRILGACHPHYAYQALLAENKIGTMLPCNVVVRQDEGGQVEVAAIDPIASMQAIDNPALGAVAVEVQKKLKSVIERLGR